MSIQIERRISFNGGEISPFTDPRIDLAKYRNSASEMKNFRPAIYGGAFSRPGTIFIDHVADQDDPPVLVSFEFSQTTVFTMVFTAGEFTVYTTGDTPAIPTMTNDSVDSIWSTAKEYTRGTWIRSVTVGYEGIYYCNEDHTSGSFDADLAAGKWTLTTAFKRATPYLASELRELQFQQLNDLVFISHPNHTPRIISRFADNEWTIAPLVQEFPALRDENITANSLTASAVTGTTTITSSLAVFDPGHVGSRWLMKHRREEPFLELALSEVAGTASAPLFVLGEWSLTVMSGAGTGDWDAIAVVERSFNKIKWETIRTLPASRADRSGIITGTEIDPCWLRIKLISKEGSTPTHGNYTLEAVDPDHYGIFEVTGYNSPTSVGAQVVFELGGLGGTTYWAEPAWSDFRGWPRTVCIHESRLMFGGNAAQPQTLWGSIIDDFYNFRLGSDDDMGLALTLAGQKAHAFQWMVSQEALLVGTGGAEGPIGPRDNTKAITPSSVRAGKFSNTGSSFIQALPVQDTVVFVQRNGRKVWEFSFVFESDGYKATDLTLLAEHIVDGQIVQVALQRNPDSVLWCVDSGGQLLGLAIERNQGVAGWFRYITDGAVESVAVISSTGEEDQVWITVNRAGGRFIERFQPEHMRLLKDADSEATQALLCCSDSSVIYNGAPTTTISGLDHLEGQSVCVLADGSPVADKTVSGGEIELDDAAAIVIAGLPYECILTPTALETNDPNSLSKVAVKGVTRLTVELWKSMGGQVSASNGEIWEKMPFLSQGDLMDEALPLFSGYKEPRVDSRSEHRAFVMIRQNQPLPLNVLSLHIWYDMNSV